MTMSHSQVSENDDKGKIVPVTEGTREIKETSHSIKEDSFNLKRASFNLKETS